MELLKALQNQVKILWTRAANSQNGQEKERLLQQYRQAYGKYVQHKQWLDLLKIQ